MAWSDSRFVVHSLCEESYNEGELKKAKEFLPGLYVPTYIPEGYELKNLTIEKYYSGDYQATYLYQKGTENLDILEYYSNDSDRIHQWQENGTLIELEDRKILVSEDSVSENPWVSVYTETCNIDISGSNSTDELIQVAKGLR